MMNFFLLKIVSLRLEVGGGFAFTKLDCSNKASAMFYRGHDLVCVDCI